MRRAMFLALLALASCSPDYPMDKPGTWSLGAYGGSNDANLRAMVVNPHDLVAGQGEPNSLGSEAGPPVKRLLTDHRRPLPALDSMQSLTSQPAADNQNGASAPGSN